MTDDQRPVAQSFMEAAIAAVPEFAALTGGEWVELEAQFAIERRQGTYTTPSGFALSAKGGAELAFKAVRAEEVEHFRSKLVLGQVDGRKYRPEKETQDCCCFWGEVARRRAVDVVELAHLTNERAPFELFVRLVVAGTRPDDGGAAAVLLRWIDSYLATAWMTAPKAKKARAKK